MMQKILGISAHISPILQLSQIAMLLANNYAIFFHYVNTAEFKVVWKSNCTTATFKTGFRGSRTHDICSRGRIEIHLKHSSQNISLFEDKE